MSTTIAAPRAKRQESHTGTSNASGNISITYDRAFRAAPMISVQLINPATSRISWSATSESNTGCTINIKTASLTNLLGIDVVSATTTNVNGQQIRLIATEM